MRPSFSPHRVRRRTVCGQSPYPRRGQHARRRSCVVWSLVRGVHVIAAGERSRRRLHQTPRSNGMSRRAELLANRIEEGSAGLAALAEGLSDTDWATATSPTDRRTVGQIVNHVALVYPIEIDLARAIAGG